MSTNIDVNKYRTQHRRCRTCNHAKSVECDYNWNCTAKRTRHFGRLSETVIAGCFCRLYDPKLENVVKFDKED